MQATAIAHPNIALIKYWGKRDVQLNLPAVPSLSVTLGEFATTTTVTWGTPKDKVDVNGQTLQDHAAVRALRFLDLVDPNRPPCHVISENNFPTAAGLASSSSAFAALGLAATHAAGQQLDRTALSRIARQGSGSACRSLWGGWVEWQMGENNDGSDSHGIPVAPADHWDVRVVVATISAGPKPIGSTEGMLQTQRTSPFYAAWVDTAQADLEEARSALLRRDLETLGTLMEQSTFKMHGTMLTSQPSICYWTPGTLLALDIVRTLRQQGVGAWATMDAGPNVKVLCESKDAERVADALRTQIQQVQILSVGSHARLTQPTTTAHD